MILGVGLDVVESWPEGSPPRRPFSRRWARARRAASHFNRSKWSGETAAPRAGRCGGHSRRLSLVPFWDLVATKRAMRAIVRK